VPTIKSLDEAAEITGVPRRTLQRWLNEGKLTPWTIEGDRRRFVDTDEIKLLREPKPAPRPAKDPIPPKPVAAARTPGQRPMSGPVHPPVAMAVIVQAGKVLMTRRRFTIDVVGVGPTQLWSFCSGEVEVDETPEAAAIRETAEEVALVVRAVDRIGEQIHPKSPDKRLFVYVACEVIAGTPQVIDHEELTEWRWCTLEEADELVAIIGGFYGPVHEYLERTLAGERT
jgi:8-oxo-dGTP diphosphatase